MGRRLSWILFLWIGAGPPLWAQSPRLPVELPAVEAKANFNAILMPPEPVRLGLPQVSAPEDGPQSSPQVDAAPPSVNFGCTRCNPYRVWFGAEYLMWWVKDAPLPIPVVTTGDPALAAKTGLPISGAIGEPGTQVLLGDGGRNLGTFSGLRLSAGAFLGDDSICFVEASGFMLFSRGNTWGANSDAAGNPPLYIPLYNVAAGREGGLPVADPLAGFAGNVTVSSALQLWGSEINGSVFLWRQPGLQVSLLGGFRYLNLQESLTIQNTTNDLVFFNSTVANDYFGTSNQFYGGQLGTRFSWQRDRFSLDLTGRVALGATHQTVDVQGNISQIALPGGFAPTPGTYAGGIFAQPSNIGIRSADEFTVVPALELKAGYQITRRWRATLGYDFLYWSRVVRPGNQLDHNNNPNDSPIFGVGGPLTPTAPAPLFQRSDFWAQGVSFGLEFRY